MVGRGDVFENTCVILLLLLNIHSLLRISESPVSLHSVKHFQGSSSGFTLFLTLSGEGR